MCTAKQTVQNVCPLDLGGNGSVEETDAMQCPRNLVYGASYIPVLCIRFYEAEQ